MFEFDEHFEDIKASSPESPSTDAEGKGGQTLWRYLGNQIWTLDTRVEPQAEYDDGNEWVLIESA